VKVTPLALPEVLLIEPRVFEDNRGWFYESFNAQRFADSTGLDVTFVQDNHSRSAKGVLRGLHYQLTPHAQGKLVRVLAGSIVDVAVDIRRSSATFGRWVAETLEAQNRRQLYVPAGFAHGFLALEDGTEVLYKTTDYYAPAAERCIRWDDPELAIAWPAGLTPLLAGKDAAAPLLRGAEIFD
jgi:dTDP-4-dehydrorhamnose 3,5-epimerase